jgi:hypothetical protein
MRWVLLLSVAVACGGCGSKHETEPSAGSGSAAAKPAGLAVIVDGKQVATVTAAQLAEWPRVDQLVPTDARRLGRWQDVELVGAKPKPTDMQSPSATYPDLVPAVFPGEGGEPSFGMFDAVELAKKGKPQLREDHLTAVRIKLLPEDAGRGQHEQGNGGGKDPTLLKITFVMPDGKTAVLDHEKLLALPRDNMPGTTDGKGWALQTILTAGGVTKFDKIVVSNANNVALNLDKTNFTADSIPFVKLNRKGELRLRIYKKSGTEWQPAGGDVSDLDGIQVLK